MSDELTCPACRSRISADGRTLLERSAHLVDLEETAAVLDKLEEHVKALKKKLADAEAESKRLSASAVKPAKSPKPKETKRAPEKKLEERDAAKPPAAKSRGGVGGFF